MKRRLTSLLVGFVATLSLAAASGCTAIVQDAARDSIAGFLTTVFSSAVNASINPG